MGQLQFRLFALGDVLLHGGEVRDGAAIIFQWGDDLFPCVKTAILAPIDYFSPPDIPGKNGGPHGHIERLILFT